MELNPCAVLTIEQAIQKLKDETTKILNAKGYGGNVILIKGVQSEDDMPTYTITLTEEQFNQIYDTDYPVILSLDPNNCYLSEIVVQKSLNNNVKEISIGLSITKFDAEIGFVSTLTNIGTFTLNNLVQTLQAQSSSILGVHYSSLEKNFGMTYMSLTEGLQLIGYLNPDISKLDKTKTFIPQVFNGTITWVEPHKYYEHDGVLKVNDGCIMFKYISTDSAARTDFTQLFNDLSGYNITASGSFTFDEYAIAMVYGIDFDSLSLCFNVLDLNLYRIESFDIAFSDLTLSSYSENVRLIQ